jgi:hypothetical protein
MRNKTLLPVPFLILILAGVISLFSVATVRPSAARPNRADALRIQTVEQEKMAALYFRALSWLSDLTAWTAQPAAKSAPVSTPAKPTVKTPQPPRCLGHLEFCAFQTGHRLAANPRVHNAS